MRADTLIEVLHAAHLTYRVQSAFPSRGALMLVAPPGALKTSFLATVEPMLGAVGASDLNSKHLVSIQDAITANKVSTLLLYDAQKLYERRRDSAEHLIGNLRALADEGFSSISQEQASHNLMARKARALVLAACTPAFYRERLGDWESSGFARRILWVHYVLKNPDRIKRAILDDERISLHGISSFPINLIIKFRPAKQDEAFLLGLLRKQQEDIPLILMKKILAVLKWRYQKKPKRAYEILEDFREALVVPGAEVTL